MNELLGWLALGVRSGLVYALLAIVLWRVDAMRTEADPAPFAGTLAEFEKDRQWLARQASPPPSE